MRLRCATDTDRDFLQRMIVHAAFRPGGAPPLAEALRAPHVVPWIDGWMRAGDLGVVAEDDDGPLGAAWCRRFVGNEVGLGGFVDAATPVLAAAIADGRRSRGIGTGLLVVRVAAARVEGVAALSLAVGRSNPALRLYERLGWQRLPDPPER